MTHQAPASRLEGRLFADEGRLCMVVDIDQATGTARVSCQRTLFDMPVAEVSARLSSYTHLTLDGLNSERTSRRLVEQDDGWYFRTRDSGMEGPFDDKEAATEAMNQFIIAAQEGRVPDQR